MTVLTNLFDLSIEDLKNWLIEKGEKPFRVQQILKWIYQKAVIDFQQMSDLSLSLRALLSEQACLTLPSILSEKPSADGTIKWIIGIEGGSAVEMVMIPERDRRTLCISSQAGCSLNCSFCHTGKQGLHRSLTQSEIIGQLWLANDRLKALGVIAEGEQGITNVVMMGMGEPLMNYAPVVGACQLMLDDRAFGLSKRRVTLSTSGVVPKIYAMADDLDCALAISLHAPNNALRDVLVPLNKKHPIEELLAACQHYVKTRDRKMHITIEYVMLDGVNDTLEHARQLALCLRDLPCKINLIPFNPFAFAPYQRSKEATIAAFQRLLMAKGYTVTVRRTRGDDVDGACGQLAGEVNDKTKRKLKWMHQNLPPTQDGQAAQEA